MDTCDARGYSSSSSATTRRLQSLYSLFGGKYTATVQIAQGAAGTSQGTQTTIVDIQIHVLQKYKRLQIQRKRQKRAKPEDLTPATRRLHSTGILDGSDETNFFETSPTEKNFNSGVGEKRARLSTTHCIQPVIPEGKGEELQGVTLGEQRLVSMPPTMSWSANAPNGLTSLGFMFISAKIFNPMMDCTYH
uniref:Retrotransposon protein, putative, Ty3-gypsy subclass n=1 Tax=Oryza sativa subsp. japonica TaxID=39947 RepID=Q2R1M3_ORYSJ|nr:retrotransposon protein, putative, Ty3-gypsy subclass [Oryza sativa Japonica Group]